MSPLQMRRWGPGIVGLGVALSLSSQINIYFLKSHSSAVSSFYVAGLVLMLLGKWFSGSQGWKDSNKIAFYTSLLCDIALIGVVVIGTFGATAILYSFGAYCYLRFLEPQYHRLKPGFPRYTGVLLTQTCWLLGFMISFTYGSNSDPAVFVMAWKIVYMYFLGSMAANVEVVGSRKAAYRPKWLDKHLTGSYQEVLEGIENIRASDARFEKLRKFGFQFMIGTGTVGLISVFTVFGLAPDNSDQLLKYILLSVLILMTIGFLIWKVGKSGDIEDSWHEGLLRIHKYLASDVPEGAVFDYRLNVAAIDVAANFLGMSRFGKWLTRPRGTVRAYEAPIIQGKVTLTDGTKMSFRLTKLARKKTTKKTNRRGNKWKTKTKTKYAERYTVELKLPKSTELPELVNPPRLSSLLPRLQGKLRVKAAGRNVLVESSTKGGDESVDVSKLLGLMVYAFRVAKS